METDYDFNDYLTAFQNIINNFHGLASDIRSNIKGLGQDKCADSLDDIASSYSTLKSQIQTAYNSDLSNMG